MGITLTQLRREVGQEIGECVVGTIDSASTDTITDADLIDLDAPTTLYDRAWVRCYWEDDSGTLYDETRRVRVTNEDTGAAGYNPTIGTLVLSRSWSYVMPVGTQYEIHKLIDPAQLDRCIQNGVERCTYLYHLALTPVSDQVVYDLSTYTWLTRPAQITDVLYVSDPTDVDETTQRPLTRWQVYHKNGGGLELHIRQQSVTTGDKLYLHCIRPYGEYLDTDTGETIDERWAKSAALVEVYTHLQHNGPAQDTERYVLQARMWAARFSENSRARVPRKRAVVRHGDTPRE